MAKVSVEIEDEAAGIDRRRFHRADLVVSIEYSTIDDLFTEFTRDINEGGVFIETESPQEVGTMVDLQFVLPGSGDPVKAPGMVVRSNDGSEPGPMGMAVEFENLPGEARERINELIRSMRAEG